MKAPLKLISTLLFASITALHAAERKESPSNDSAPPASSAKSVIAGADARCDAMLRRQLKYAFPPTSYMHYQAFALAAYWLNERTAEADQAILTEREKEFLPAIAKNDFYGYAYILERIYFLFSRSSKHFPGRMSAEAESALLDMLWRWAEPVCRRELTLPERDWWSMGSENNHTAAWSSFWGAAQIFAQHPDYKNRRYADGTTVPEMAKAFDDYYKRYARNAATSGLLVECNSGYNKYTLGGWYNMADFAEDPELRRRMSMLLDLFWADWAIEEINGVRGGSRHRCYPGENSTSHSNMDELAWYPFGFAPANSQAPGVVCGATTFWRPSSLVAELALDWNSRGVYEYISRRPGRLEPRKTGEPPLNFVTDPKHPLFLPNGVAALRPEGGGLLRYSYCTPDFVMGTSMVEALTAKDWAGMSSQNRWEGAIFAGHPTARIYVQTRGNTGTGSSYNANWSVQKRGVLIVQRLKTANAKGQRVWFDGALTRAERDGWVFAEAPQAYAAVRVVNGDRTWKPDAPEMHHGDKVRALANGMWLECADEFSPVIIEVARKADCKDFAAFQASTLGNALKWENHRLDYTSALNHATLTLFADYSQVPQVDGVPVNYAPKKAYVSPFIEGDFGSGVVTLRKGDRKLVLDFN